MNYKNLYKNAIPTRTDNNLYVFALLSGLAAGTAIALLLAPRSGRESIKLLLKKFNSTEQKHYNELEEQLLEELRKTARNHPSAQRRPKFPQSSSISPVRQDHGKRSQQISEDPLLLE